MTESGKYKNIFKSTFLFSFVQVVRILVAVVKNKVVSILLGAEGMGIMGLFQTTLNFIKTGSGLGVSQSAVRDISEANASEDRGKFSRTICVVRRIVLYTSLLGASITILLSPLLSKWTFGNSGYVFSFIILSIAIFFEIFVENQLAILKGMRRLRSLAKASIWGSLVGLVTGLPLYYFMGVKGIVPSFVITAFTIYLVTRYYVNQVSYDKIRIPLRQVFKEATPMVKMGIALMLVGLIGTFFDLIVVAYLRSHGGLSIVGYYSAGSTIVTSYIGVVITAMSTDYYPRISAVNKDNVKLTDEVNTQSEVGLLMAFPLVVIFVFFSPLFINILYTDDFIRSIDYTDYALIGSVITICSNSMGMILLAKQASSIFLWSVIGQRVVCLFAYIFLYNSFGLAGLGYAYVFMGLLHIVLMSIIMKLAYGIKFRYKVIVQLFLVIAVILLSKFARGFENVYLRYAIGLTIIIVVCIYSLLFMKRYMGINMMQSVLSRFNKKS